MNLRGCLFGGCKLEPRAADVGLTLLRVASGCAMAFAHGLGKVYGEDRGIGVSEGFVEGVDKLGFPLPVAFAWAAALSEFLGGLLLAVGAMTRAAAFLILSTMIVAFFIRHGADPFSKKELAYLYGVVSIFFLLAGSGRYSVDALLRPKAS
jgi:putative oxidoreductase